MRSHFWMLFLTVLLMGFGVALCSAEAATPPDPQTKAQFDQRYGKELRQALHTKNDQVIVKMAQQLINEAPYSEEEKSLAIMQYEKAYELASPRSGGVDVAVSAMQALAELDDSREDDCTLKTIEAYRHAIDLVGRFEKYPTAWTFFSKAFNTADQAMADKRFDQAQKIYSQIASVAKKMSSDVNKLAGEGVTDARMSLKAQRTIKALETRLAATPEDTRVAKTLVESLLIDMNQPQRAAEFVDQADDPDLAKRVGLLQQEIADLTAEDAYDVGDWAMRAITHRARFKAVQRSLYARAESAFEHYLASNPNPSRERSEAEGAIKKARQVLEDFEDARQLAHEIPTMTGVAQFTCDFYCDVYLNGTDLGRMYKDEVRSLQVTLKPGDIISAKLKNGAGTKGFWFRFESDDKRVSFSSGRDYWYAYVPKRTATWWQVTPSKKHPRCRQEKYVASSFVRMLRQHSDEAVKRQVIWGASREEQAYIYFVVK